MNIKGFKTTCFTLPIALLLAAVVVSLNPSPPEVVREIALDLTSQKRFCELHGIELQTDVIPIECVNALTERRNNPFPNAHECWGGGGCGTTEDKWAKVGYCQKCRRALHWQRFKWDMKVTWENLFSR